MIALIALRAPDHSEDQSLTAPVFIQVLKVLKQMFLSVSHVYHLFVLVIWSSDHKFLTWTSDLTSSLEFWPGPPTQASGQGF